QSPVRLEVSSRTVRLVEENGWLRELFGLWVACAGHGRQVGLNSHLEVSQVQREDLRFFHQEVAYDVLRLPEAVAGGCGTVEEGLFTLQGDDVILDPQIEQHQADDFRPRF